MQTFVCVCRGEGLGTIGREGLGWTVCRMIGKVVVEGTCGYDRGGWGRSTSCKRVMHHHVVLLPAAAAMPLPLPLPWMSSCACPDGNDAPLHMSTCPLGCMLPIGRQAPFRRHMAVRAGACLQPMHHHIT